MHTIELPAGLVDKGEDPQVGEALSPARAARLHCSLLCCRSYWVHSVAAGALHWTHSSLQMALLDLDQST